MIILKFKSNFMEEKTVADYDGSATDEMGFVSDNRMYALQTGLEHIRQIIQKTILKFIIINMIGIMQIAVT